MSYHQWQICNKCMKKLLVDEFARKGNGIQKICKRCHREYSRQHYRDNKSYYIEKSGKQNKKIRDIIHAIKESTPCKDCRQSFPYYVMDFDHLQDKEFNLSRASSFKAAMEEISKCDIVCSNCHRIRTYKRASGEI